jgi:hypothetical protein
MIATNHQTVLLDANHEPIGMWDIVEIFGSPAFVADFDYESGTVGLRFPPWGVDGWHYSSAQVTKLASAITDHAPTMFLGQFKREGGW